MTLLSTKRLTAVLRRYGRIATIDRTPSIAVHLLINELLPVVDAALPDQVIAGEGVLLVPVNSDGPMVGDIVIEATNRWVLNTVLPLADRSKRLFEIRASQAVAQP